MKTINKFFGLLVLTVTMFSFTANASTVVGESNTDMGKYWLKEASVAIEVNGEALPTYVIHYDNYANPVYVGVLKTKKCKTYIVRTEGIEVVYTCKNGTFGIGYTPKKLATLPASEVKEKLDRQSFLNQRVISSNNLSEKKHLGLIASYLPEVIL